MCVGDLSHRFHIHFSIRLLDLTLATRVSRPVVHFSFSLFSSMRLSSTFKLGRRIRYRPARHSLADFSTVNEIRYTFLADDPSHSSFSLSLFFFSPFHFILPWETPFAAIPPRLLIQSRSPFNLCVRVSRLANGRSLNRSHATSSTRSGGFMSLRYPRARRDPLSEENERSASRSVRSARFATTIVIVAVIIEAGNRDGRLCITRLFFSLQDSRCAR